MTDMVVASAAAERAALASLGRDLARGARAEPLTADRRTAPPARFSDLRQAPAWLRLSPEALRDLARRAALQSAALTLAASIDGAMLGRIAETCGETALDDSIAAARPGDDRAIPDPDRIEADGLSLMAAALPVSLRAYLPASGAGATPFPDADRARAWVERVVPDEVGA